MSTSTQPRWHHLGATVAGTSHQARGIPCQDYSLSTCLQADEGEVLLLVASDGAGSAAHSDAGSAAACRAVLELATDWFAAGGRTAELDETVLEGWIRHSRAVLEGLADERDVQVRDLACTILIAVVGAEAASFAQIGDGAMVMRTPDGYEAVFWPDHGEYVNTTRFLSDTDALSHVRYRQSGGPIDEVAVMTDGIEPLALHYATRSVHEPFFRPLFQTLQREAIDGLLHRQIRAFLESDRINARTDDDKTLLIASRSHSPDSPADSASVPVATAAVRDIVHSEEPTPHEASSGSIPRRLAQGILCIMLLRLLGRRK